MEITPLGHRILVKRISVQEKTFGGIILPETFVEQPLEGIIVALGKNNYNKKGDPQKFNVSVGDRVTFASWGSELDITIDNKEYAFISEETIIGILR